MCYMFHNFMTYYAAKDVQKEAVEQLPGVYDCWADLPVLCQST